jgi:hypothetical protein
MTVDEKEFYKYGKPVAKLFQTLSTSFFDTYEYGRPFGEGVDGECPPDFPESRWGLEFCRVMHNTPVWGDECLQTVQGHVLYHVVSNAKANEDELQAYFDEPDGGDHEQALRNLSNAWRDEFAVNDPIEGEVADRMRTAEWRISMAYYAIYKAFSALMRSKFDDILTDGRGGTHVRMWKKHRWEMLDELTGSLYVYPFMYFPEGDFSDCWFDWSSPYPDWNGRSSDIDSVLNEKARDSLSEMYRYRQSFHEKPDAPCPTFFDMLLNLRHWANYHRGGVFSRLYGSGLRFAIDEGLRLITFTGLAITEVGLIQSLGYDTVKEEFLAFEQSSKEGVTDSSYLPSRRFAVYEQALAD